MVDSVLSTPACATALWYFSQTALQHTLFKTKSLTVVQEALCLCRQGLPLQSLWPISPLHIPLNRLNVPITILQSPPVLIPTLQRIIMVRGCSCINSVNCSRWTPGSYTEYSSYRESRQCVWVCVVFTCPIFHLKVEGGQLGDPPLFCGP